MKLSQPLLNMLEEQFGDSFYILDLQTFQDNYSEFIGAFRQVYRNTNIAYSYKTNYTPRLCQLVDSMGGYAEVVSNMEYDLAIRIGVAPQRIIFNGPYKHTIDIEKAVRAGSIVNLDSYHEVTLIEKIAERLPDHSFLVGLRCNFDIAEGKISRFGFDVEGEEFKAAFETLRGISNCRVAGLHCHYSTQNRSVESYALRTRKLLELCSIYFQDHYPDFINVGGGFFSKMSDELQKQFSFPIPSYQEYAEAIAAQLANAFPSDSGPQLILEPGSAIVANTMQFAAKIIDIKTIRSRTVALSSGSIHNIKPTLHKKNQPMHVFNSGDIAAEGIHRLIDIVGYTCMEHDCLYEGYDGPLAVGDWVVFDNIGAYTIVMKPPFIKPCPSMIAYNPVRDTFELAKRSEEMADVFSTYVFE